MIHMSATSEMIRDVLSLPRPERSFLARKLIESLEADESFTAEELRSFEKRSQEIRDGVVTPLSLGELRQKVNSRFA
jgi:hypothetical protein